MTLYALNDEPLFYQHMDDALIPHLKLVHKYPQCFKTVGIDRGAIRFVLSGATLMVPGLISKGGRLPNTEAGEEDVKKGDVVVVKAEGKEEVVMIGVLERSGEEMRREKRGVAVERGHFVGDGLWKLEIH